MYPASQQGVYALNYSVQFGVGIVTRWVEWRRGELDMNWSNKTRGVFRPKMRGAIRWEALNRRKLGILADVNNFQLFKRCSVTDICQSSLNIDIAVGDIQGEDLSCINHKRNDAGSDKNSNEQRRYGIESGPAVELYQECRYNNSNRPQRILCDYQQSSRKSIKHLTAMTCKNTPRMLWLWPSWGWACVCEWSWRFGMWWDWWWAAKCSSWPKR